MMTCQRCKGKAWFLFFFFNFFLFFCWVSVEIIPPDKQEPTRNELGHWVKGSSGNPNGRPHKPSITIMIQNELEKVEPNSKKTWLQLIVARLLQMAVIEGDTNILKTIW